jgi:hypothetical protein
VVSSLANLLGNGVAMMESLINFWNGFEVPVFSQQLVEDKIENI